MGSISDTYVYIKLIVLTSQQLFELMRSSCQKFWKKMEQRNIAETLNLLKVQEQKDREC
jgi:hypothetical protein